MELTQAMSKLNSEFSANRTHRYLQYLAVKDFISNFDYPEDYYSRYIKLTIDGIDRQKRHCDRMRAINKAIGELYLDKISLEQAGQARLERKARESIEKRYRTDYLDLDVSNSYRRRLQSEKRKEILQEADRVLNESAARTKSRSSLSYKRDLNYLGQNSLSRTRIQSPVDYAYRRETPSVTFPEYPGSNYASRSKQLHTEVNSSVPFYSKFRKNRQFQIFYITFSI